MKNILRCAIYTRKSTEEGLDQAFNSLDAQREACEAYILSQKHEGWNIIAHKYDDGGFSGGNMERPALCRLLADIKAGKVNVVVVYKVDRLTRSLSDFAKIVEQFDGQGVSFVSVTQQFNTTSSMGRLTLNVLLSFAQFEREVSGERIRDKIAASKKKGMWMGGTVPLGYATVDKKLQVVPPEAKTVKHIYERYLVLGSVRDLEAELKNEGILSKEGAVFSRGALYQILKNPVYIGKVRHKGNIYDGQQKAILPDDLWQNVQEKLKEHGVAEYSRKSQMPEALLAGLLFTGDGTRLTPTHTNKQGKRYRYYYDAETARGTEKDKPIHRVSAGEIERLVIHALVKHFDEKDDGIAVCKALQSADLKTQREAILKTVDKIEILGKSVKVTVKYGDGTELLNIPYQIQTVNAGSKVMAADKAGIEEKARNQSLLKSLIRGYVWREKLLETPGMTLAQLMKDEGIKGPYIMELITLTYMAPSIIEGILRGKCPANFDLHEVARGLPLNWDGQKRKLDNEIQ